MLNIFDKNTKKLLMTPHQRALKMGLTDMRFGRYGKAKTVTFIRRDKWTRHY